MNLENNRNTLKVMFIHFYCAIRWPHSLVNLYSNNHPVNNLLEPNVVAQTREFCAIFRLLQK